MHYGAFVASALLAGTVAMPHNNLEERGIVYVTTTEIDYVNVLVTVTARQMPKTTPMWFFPDPRTRPKPIFWWPRTTTSIPHFQIPTPTTKTSSQVSTSKTSSTPKASSTPKPSSTPVSRSSSRSSSKVSSTPTPSSTSKASSTPKPASSSAASSAPKVSSSSTLKASSTPAVSSTPKSSSSPASSSSPRATVAATPSVSSTRSIGPSHSSGTIQAYFTAGADYQNAILYHHNARRANHNAAPLTWDSDCENNARLAAERCDFSHYIPDGVREGQNLFITNQAIFNVTAAITESWYKSEFPFMQGHYGEAQPDDATFHKVGHLTQVVWQSTTAVGCVSLDCGDKMTNNGQKTTLNKFTVCNYSPPGNIKGKFDTGVLPPQSTVQLGSWTD